MSSVLITGASQGIGRATAIELAHRGHRVVATARRLESLDDLPVDQRLPLDVTDPDSVRDAVEAAGAIDVLVNNAGQTIRGPLESVPPQEVLRLVEVNTVGALRVTQALLPAMRARGTGRILFVSSILGRLTIPLTGAYSVSKWALEAMAETLAFEVAHFGIAVTLLEPGAVRTAGVSGAPSYTEGSPYEPLAQQLAIARGEPLSVEAVAVAIGDAIELRDPPLRIPIGSAAQASLAARKSHPDEIAFRFAPIDW